MDAQKIIDDLERPPRDFVLDPHIDRADPNAIHAINGFVTITALDGARVFKRRAIHNVATPAAHESCWIVIELNGVRVYVKGDEIVVSTQDLNP